jgi:hypothetical protein
MQALESNDVTNQAIEQLKKLLSQQSDVTFRICLDPVSGEKNEAKDQALLQSLQSSSPDERAKAVLQFIYQVRCNLFHGRKGVDPVQKELLIPLANLLEKIIKLIYDKLDSAKYN